MVNMAQLCCRSLRKLLPLPRMALARVQRVLPLIFYKTTLLQCSPELAKRTNLKLDNVSTFASAPNHSKRFTLGRFCCTA